MRHEWTFRLGPSTLEPAGELRDGCVRYRAEFRKREAVCLALQEMAKGGRVIELGCDNSRRARHDDRNSELMQAI